MKRRMCKHLHSGGLLAEPLLDFSPGPVAPHGQAVFLVRLLVEYERSDGVQCGEEIEDDGGGEENVAEHDRPLEGQRHYF